jgi:hypothetical protein
VDKGRAELQNSFEQIKREFFPKWDRLGEWKIEWASENDMHGSQGKCCSEKKVILVSYLSYELIIHEICHAIAGPHHGKTWANRFLKAANHAGRIGHIELHNSIINECNLYELEIARITAQVIYQRIEDAAAETGLSYEQVIDFCSLDIGMSIDELQNKFRLCRKAYNRGIENR